MLIIIKDLVKTKLFQPNETRSPRHREVGVLQRHRHTDMSEEHDGPIQ